MKCCIDTAPWNWIVKSAWVWKHAHCTAYKMKYELSDIRLSCYAKFCNVWTAAVFFLVLSYLRLHKPQNKTLLKFWKLITKVPRQKIDTQTWHSQLRTWPSLAWRLGQGSHKKRVPHGKIILCRRTNSYISWHSINSFPLNNFFASGVSPTLEELQVNCMCCWKCIHMYHLLVALH